MGLFSKVQMAQIMASAEKSKKLEEPPPKTKVNAKNLSAKINEISAKVVEHFKDSKAELITTPEALHDYISKMLKAGIGAIDTETTGLDKIKDTIVGVSLYYPGGVEVYIPIKHIVPIFDEPYKDQLTYEQVATELQRLADSNIKLIFANADFDLAMVFKDLKVDLLPVFWYDVIIAWRCIKEDEKDNSLKGLYTKYPLKGKMDRMKFSDFFTADLFPYCNPQVAKLYAAADAKYTYELCMWQLPYLKKDNPKCQKHHFEAIADLVWGVEFPLTKICQLMHRRGIYLEKSVAAMLRTKYHGLLDAEYKKMYSLLDAVLNDPKYYSTSKRPFKTAKDFNPNSTPHVKWLCYDWLKLGNGKTNSTDKSVLSTYSHPLIAQILKCRSLVTLIGTFVDKLPDGTTDDSRIHCTFKQIGADCIVGDSLILTNHGYCPIIDLFDGTENDGEYIPDSTSLYDKDLHKVTTSHRVVYHNTSTIRLKLRGGFSVEGTPNHPIICSTISRDDVYRTATNKRRFGDKTEFRRLDDVSIGDAVYIPIGYNIFPDEYVPTGFTLKAKYRDFQLDCKVPEYFTEDFAELLGMYFADGSIHDNCGHFSIRISNGDQDVIDRATNLVHSVFALPTKVNWGHTTWCTEFGNKRIECIRNVIGRGAKNKYVCKQIMQSPRSVVCAFIRGTTLDSSYDPDRQRLAINYFLKESADFVQQALANMGILSSLSIQKNADTIHYRVSVSGEFYKKFIDTVGVVQSKKRDIRDTYKKSGFYIKDDKYFAYVEEISYDNADVYDVTVPESHSFVANGMINHNTGRMSSASPNLQNVPSRSNDIRHMFRATPGYVLMSSDYSQQEPKLTAYVSGEPKMINTFKEGKDIYATIGSIAFNVPYEDCLEFNPQTHEYQPEGKLRRTRSKPMVLGINYGMEAKALGEKIFGDDDTISEEERTKQAKKVFDAVMTGFPVLKQAIAGCKLRAKKIGYTETILGRRRHFPNLRLPKYEFVAEEGYVNPDIDPLDPSTFDVPDGIPERIQKALYSEFMSYKYNGQVYKRIKQLHEQDHIKVINNSAKIAEAERESWNAVIQGKPYRFNCPFTVNSITQRCAI